MKEPPLQSGGYGITGGGIRFDQRDQISIKLAVFAPFSQKVHDSPERLRGTVGPGLRQGLEDIGNYDNTGFKRQIFCRFSKGIAAAIKLFVMICSPQADLFKSFNFFEDAIGHVAVMPHYGKIDHVQLAFLLQNFIRNLQFSKIVK